MLWEQYGARHPWHCWILFPKMLFVLLSCLYSGLNAFWVLDKGKNQNVCTVCGVLSIVVSDPQCAQQQVAFWSNGKPMEVHQTAEALQAPPKTSQIVSKLMPGGLKTIHTVRSVTSRGQVSQWFKLCGQQTEVGSHRQVQESTNLYHKTRILD